MITNNTDNAKYVGDVFGRVLLAPVGPVILEDAHVPLELLELLLRQLVHVLLQLVHRNQLTVRRQAAVLMKTPEDTSCQAAAHQHSTRWKNISPSEICTHLLNNYYEKDIFL